MDPEAIFKALADRTRQRVLTVLSAHELGVSELVEVLRQPQSTVSRHLRTLRQAGLIHDQRAGNTVVYSVSSAAAVASSGDSDGLAPRVLEWIAEQPLDAPMRGRLSAVVERRRAMSDRFFDRVGRQWDVVREEAFGRLFQLEALLALLPRDWVVADIGTGTGHLLPVLARHFVRVVGVDPVDAMLKAAAARIERAGAKRNVVLKLGDLSRLPIKAASVDVALAMLVLHHVPSPQRAVREFGRIVRPGGSVLIVEQMAHGNERFRERMQDRWWGFDPQALARQLETVGFEEVGFRMLATVEPAADAPELFAVTGTKVQRGRADSRKHG